MQPAEASRVVSILTAAYGLLAAIALIEGVVSHRGIVAVQVVAFGALAFTGGRKLQSWRAQR
ncbi:hypothetical protein FB458_0292 [Lapillicoccus jejuensis]|uniref:Uncharacterized protein n=2 Tax=Lapillicoccus jejuensis TaxID=402171 RepID=A0A542DW14_9MICO|nr:hypothetical protein FB458_0292 [Lapillicoccus jejuensis]